MIAGIDLGTTNSLIGVMDSGFPVLLAGENGSRLTPSVVHFPEGDAPPLVGASALRMRALDPARTVSSVKRYIGRRFGELDAAERSAPFAVERARDGGILIGPRRLSPEQVSAILLGKLRSDAECTLGIEMRRAVITVPAYFNDARRQATKEAGRLAGFDVERILNEPTAAALAHGLDRGGERRRVAVFDLGGGTFDISILELHDGVFQVVSTNGDTRLGGDDIDAALVSFLHSEWSVPHDDALLLARIREAAIGAKHRLSDSQDTVLRLPFASGTSREMALDRAVLENLARPILARARPCCLRALSDAGLAAGEIDDLLLVGGATRMPMVREFARDLFGVDPLTDSNPDESVALGAVLQGGILSGQVTNALLLDVTPLSLGIETFGGLMNVLIPRNTTIPVKAGELFTNAVSGQSAMQIHVLQGERELARDNWALGRFDLPFVPAPKGGARVGVQFEIDADGILRVLARDTATGLEKVVEMKSAVDVSDEAVERMISESVEHAFEDVEARRFAETRQKSADLLGAVRTALTKADALLEPGERDRIEVLAARVGAALAAEDAPALAAANLALDESTRDLAARLLDQAMETALKRRGIL